MLGMSGAEYTKALCNPKVKVGSEYVTKGQTVDQVLYALKENGYKSKIYHKLATLTLNLSAKVSTIYRLSQRLPLSAFLNGW